MQWTYNTAKERIKSIGEGVVIYYTSKKEMFARFAELMLVAIIFFGLGLLYAEHLPKRTMPISFEMPASNALGVSVSEIVNKPEVKQVQALTGNEEYVASKNGTKYYLTTCKSTIKEANKVFFKTKEDAEKAGFTPSKTCFK